MGRIISKSRLAIVLSGLKCFESPKVRQEQYTMDGEIGASVLWSAFLLEDVGGKVIVDLGCGTGILGIGCLLLGARKVFFVDSDKSALDVVKNNISQVKSEDYQLQKWEIMLGDIVKLEIKADTIVQNPPFGTKVRHNDALFLEKALETARVVYSFHKSESKGFLERFAAKKNAKITHIWRFDFPLKATFGFHRRRIHRIDVSCFRFEKTS